MYFVGFQGFHGFPWFSISRLPMVLHGLLCGTLRSWLHWISTIIRILSPGLGNDNTLNWCYGNFPTKQHSSGLLEKYQNNILMHCYPPTLGTRSRYMFKVGDKLRSNVDLVIFQQSWHVWLENWQNNISRYGFSTIWGTRFYSCWHLMKPGSQSETHVIVHDFRWLLVVFHCFLHCFSSSSWLQFFQWLNMVWCSCDGFQSIVEIIVNFLRL